MTNIPSDTLTGPDIGTRCLFIPLSFPCSGVFGTVAEHKIFVRFLR